jgi:hypothetical protein
MIQHEAGDGKKDEQRTAKQGDIEVDVARPLNEGLPAEDGQDVRQFAR